MNKRINEFNQIYKMCNTISQEEKIKKCSDELSTPLYLDIELTNCCNIQCNMCPVGVGDMKRQKGFMMDEVFGRICNQIEQYKIPAVRFIRWGEPTIHPKFMNYIKQIKSLGKKVHFNTNGMSLNEGMMHEIIDAKVDSIKFSFQGIDDVTYGEMRSGGNYQQLFENIKKLYQIRGDSEKPYIAVSTTVTYESDTDIEHFKESVKPYCDYVNVGKTQMEHVDVSHMKLNDKRKQIYEKYITQEQQMVKKHMDICPEIWDKLSINWDGSVSACCRDYDNKMVIGNIMEESIVELFHNKKEEQYRQIIEDRNYELLPLCKNCFEYIYLQK